MQIVSKDGTVKSTTIQDTKYFNSQSLAIQAKKAEQVVFLMLGIEEAFGFMVMTL